METATYRFIMYGIKVWKRERARDIKYIHSIAMFVRSSSHIQLHTLLLLIRSFSFAWFLLLKFILCSSILWKSNKWPVTTDTAAIHHVFDHDGKSSKSILVILDLFFRCDWNTGTCFNVFSVVVAILHFLAHLSHVHIHSSRMWAHLLAIV